MFQRRNRSATLKMKNNWLVLIFIDFRGHPLLMFGRKVKETENSTVIRSGESIQRLGKKFWSSFIAIQQ
jgi:hypothetical protein